MNGSPLVLHLNGAPAVGKSTLAARWADRHPGTLLLDIDVLRTWVSGWRGDFAATGPVARPLAFAMIAAMVAQERDVVLPQLLADPTELLRFRDAAESAGGRWIEVLVEADDAKTRFAHRATDLPHLAALRNLVDAGDSSDELATYTQRLRAISTLIDGTVVLRTTDGDVDGAYAALEALVAEAASQS